MGKVKTYHRPDTIEEALTLLARPGATILGGGTQLIPRLDEAAGEVIDLQALGLDEIMAGDGRISFGAMVRLQDIVDHPDVPPLVREMARREGPNTFRNAGTIAGVVVTAGWESELFAALLVHEAEVTVRTPAGEQSIPLANSEPLLSGKQVLVTAVTVRTGGQSASARVARTPADQPIVAIAGRRDEQETVLLAACGVAERPVLVAADNIGQLTPPADFRGSRDYRRAMAELLTKRVLAQLDS